MELFVASRALLALLRHHVGVVLPGTALVDGVLGRKAVHGWHHGVLVVRVLNATRVAEGRLTTAGIRGLLGNLGGGRPDVPKSLALALETGFIDLERAVGLAAVDGELVVEGLLGIRGPAQVEGVTLRPLLHVLARAEVLEGLKAP